MQQIGNVANGSVAATTQGAIDQTQPAQSVEVGGTGTDSPPPVRRLGQEALRNLAAKYRALFDRYASERIPAEQKWLKNQRQYLGVYDPEIERQLPPNRSRAYPRLTRMKCIAMLSRIMNLMFPGNEDNWELKASPSPSMSPDDVATAVTELMQQLQQEGIEAEITPDIIDEAVRTLADKRARTLSNMIRDQLHELGGSQTVDWIALNRKVVDSGIKYGIGVLEGPYVRTEQQTGWVQMMNGEFVPETRTIYKPQYDFLPVWDFYPDMSAKTLPGEGYFVRKVLGRSKLRKLAERKDFFSAQVKQVLVQVPGGNYRERSFESELKTMGLSIHAQHSTSHSARERYEVIVWKGPVSGNTLREAGADVPDDMLADDVEAEIWMVENWVIKAEINAWRKLGLQLDQVHVFSFDEDDTSPIGQGLPGIVRDSQLSVAASVRMLLDNASVTCGPNLEVNTALLRGDQDLTSVSPYKVWYRDDEGLTAQFPAVRELRFDGHINELQSLAKMFIEFADMETFIGPATGGDFQRMPSEPMRTAAGASMLRGDAALPFKDVVRNFDSFTQSVLWSLVSFNKKFNPELAPEGDYDVIPRGATSLIAKEVRGTQIDMLSQTLTPEELDHIDERKFIEAKMRARDLEGMLVSNDEAQRRKQGRAQMAQQERDRMARLAEAEIKKVASDAFKNVAQGQRNASNADSIAIRSAIDIMESGNTDEVQGANNRDRGAASSGG